jgi:hypothetical protein
MPLQEEDEEEEKYGSPTPLVFIFPLFNSFHPFFAVCHTEDSVLVQVVRTFSIYHWKKDQHGTQTMNDIRKQRKYRNCFASIQV